MNGKNTILKLTPMRFKAEMPEMYVAGFIAIEQVAGYITPPLSLG